MKYSGNNVRYLSLMMVLISFCFLHGLPETTVREFHCGIIPTGSCGEGNLGSLMVLSNSDSKTSYKVTVRINWQKGTKTGEYDKVYTVPAGGKVTVGCTKSSSSGSGEYSTSYTYTVVGEAKS